MSERTNEQIPLLLLQVTPDSHTATDSHRQPHTHNAQPQTATHTSTRSDPASARAEARQLELEEVAV